MYARHDLMDKFITDHKHWLNTLVNYHIGLLKYEQIDKYDNISRCWHKSDVNIKKGLVLVHNKTHSGS